MDTTAALKRAFSPAVRKHLQDIVSWRRDFHRHPELGFEERRTSETVRRLLREWGIPFRIVARTGVVGVLEGLGNGPTVGIRADMDALPVQEKTGLPFASCTPGVMHACGHDAHTATLLGAARILSEKRSLIPGKILFIFQPAEERPPGGAKAMLKEGLGQDADRFVGFHYMPRIRFGGVWIGEGAVMAHTDFFEMTVTGKGGHGSGPHLTRDPVTCAGHLVSALQTVVSRRTDPRKTAVLSLGSISGGQAFNIIPDRVTMKGTVRTFEDDVQRTVRTEIRRIVSGVCSALGCTGSVKYDSYCPSVLNDPALARKYRDVTVKVMGQESLVEMEPSTGGEDFAFFSRVKPSCYLFIGVGSECGILHSCAYRFDESILADATLLLCCLACSS